MLKKVSLIAVLLICALVIAQAQIVWAKGPPQQVSVTGAGIDGEFFTTRAELLEPLGFVVFENINAEVEPLTDAGDPYVMTRYYQMGDNRFEPFDRVEYYPEAQVVHVLGIVNGSSEYDDTWFEVSPAGAAAFDLLLAQAAAEPYLAVTDQLGSIHFFDPNTLAPRGTYQAEIAPLYADDIRAEAFGRGLSLSLNGEAQGELQINLESAGECFSPTGQTANQQTITSFDGRWIAMITHSADRFIVSVYAEHWEQRPIQLEPPTADLTYSGAWDAEGGKFYLLHTREGAATLSIFDMLSDVRARHLSLDVDDAGALQLAGADANTAYFYTPMNNGILAVNTINEQMETLLADTALAYARLDDARGSLYGITPDGTDWRVFASSLDGVMLATQPIPETATAVGVLRLNPGVMEIVASGGAVDRPARNPFTECGTVNSVWGA